MTWVIAARVIATPAMRSIWRIGCQSARRLSGLSPEAKVHQRVSRSPSR